VNIQRYYTYLTRARRDLWAFLETLPDDVLSAPVIPGERLHSIKDLVLHTAVVEDSWVHEDILRDEPVWTRTEGYPTAFEAKYHADKPLGWLLSYWRAVEASTLAYLETVNDTELERRVAFADHPDESASAHELLWHVAQHETRHTAQIVLLARLAGFKPPQLDLIGFLDTERNSA
jgi:uncharacterized damage-inducible protein DinB